MARYKKRWLANLQMQPCARCGYGEVSVEQTKPHRTTTDQAPNTFTYAGPSAQFRRTNILTPESPDSAMEEGLLMRSDFDTGYGSIGRSEPTIDQPEQVVVGKGKKKKVSSSNSYNDSGKKIKR